MIVSGEWQNSIDVGGCSFCNSHITAEGSVPHRVFVVLVGSHQIRVCQRALHELWLKLPGILDRGLCG